jgi:hypothetical protein
MRPNRQSTLRQTDNSESVLIAQASSWIRFLTFPKRKRGKVFLKNFGNNPKQDTMSKSRSLQYKQLLPWKTENIQNRGSRNGHFNTINNKNLKKNLTKIITILFPKVFGLSTGDSDVTFRPRIHNGIFVTLVRARCQFRTGFFISITT